MKRRAWIFGEVLFDHFPDGNRVLGGAPFNVAWHLQAFGQAPWFISRVGDDPEGDAVRAAMRDWGMDTGGLQIDAQHPTGRVSVRFADGEPRYDIVRPCAYDAIEAVPVDATDCRLLYHGTLALRDEISRHTAQALRAGGPETVFVDVNLRPPWWEQAAVLDLLRHAHWVKLNAAELDLLSPAAAGDAAQAVAFLDEYALQGLVLTRGAAGAEVITAAGERCALQPQAQTRIEVVDTVGAGDAFTAVMILGLTNNWPLQLMLRRAQDFASHLVGRRGATVADPDFYHRFTDDWQLER
jgi:fructokinase